MGQVNEPPQRDISILAFAVSNINHRAKVTKATREYKRYYPHRYTVRSKVKQNVRIQEKEVHKKFSAALETMLANQQHRMSKDQARSINTSQYMPKANGSLLQSVASRLSKSPRKSNYDDYLKMPQNISAETMKTKAYSNMNDQSYMDMSNISPMNNLDRSYGARSAKKS